MQRFTMPASFGMGRARSRLVIILAIAALAAAALVTTVVTAGSATAADNPYQRGPDPTVASVAATRGPFATAQLTVPSGNGFGGGYIYYPTDTSMGTWAAVAIVPGYSALFANEEAWMGPWLASFGFVVIGIETTTRSDGADARATELLAALDYLTQRSQVRDRVDPTRLGIMGHSAGGAGTILAAERRPSLKAAVGLAPGTPGSLSMATDRVPTMVIGGQTDPTVTPSYLDSLYATLPASTQSDFVQITGADHLFFTRANNTEMKVLIPWLKIFLDNDTRYTQFLCPSLADRSGISLYRSKCPYVPPGVTPPAPSTVPPSRTAPPSSSTPPSSTPPSSAVPPSTVPPSSTTPPSSAVPTTMASPSVTPSTPTTACAASYRTVNAWQGGFQGEVTVTAGSIALNGWSVRWTLTSGQTITQVWNGTLTASGSAVTVRNASYNNSVPASGSTVFGFLANGTPSTPSITCASP